MDLLLEVETKMIKNAANDRLIAKKRALVEYLRALRDIVPEEKKLIDQQMAGTSTVNSKRRVIARNKCNGKDIWTRATKYRCSKEGI